jgi:hypothetical protein
VGCRVSGCLIFCDLWLRYHLREKQDLAAVAKANDVPSSTLRSYLFKGTRLAFLCLCGVLSLSYHILICLILFSASPYILLVLAALRVRYKYFKLLVRPVACLGAFLRELPGKYT